MKTEAGCRNMEVVKHKGALVLQNSSFLGMSKVTAQSYAQKKNREKQTSL